MNLYPIYTGYLLFISHYVHNQQLCFHSFEKDKNTAPKRKVTGKDNKIN